MQILTNAGDFIGWGTYRGVGTHDPNASSNCPDDFSSHWHVYVDGRKMGTYFCHVGYGDVLGTDTDQLFTLRYGDCSGDLKWRAFLNGTRLTCQLINADSAYAMVVGGEVAGTQVLQTIDIRYHDLDYYDADHDAWWSWSSYLTTTCENLGFDVNKLAADDVWTELTP